MKMTFVTVSSPAAKYLSNAARKIAEDKLFELELTIYNGRCKVSAENAEKIKRDIAVSDITFLDLMGSPPQVVDIAYSACKESKGDIIPYGASAREFLRLGKFTSETMGSGNKKAPSMEAMKKMQIVAEGMGKILPGKMRDMRNYSLLMKYFQNATPDNIYNMLLLLLREYGGYKWIKEPQLPVLPPPIALYSLPDMRAFYNVKEYETICAFKKSLPNVLLIFSSYAYPTDTASCVYEMQKALSKVCNVYAVGTSGSFKEYEKELRRICTDTSGKIKLILNCTPFRLAAGPMGGDAEAGIKFLKDMDVPYLHPFFLTRRTEKDWKSSPAGCSSAETMISMMLPELDGSLDTIPIGAMSEATIDEDFQIETHELVAIEERMTRLASRVKKYIALAGKANKDKKIAIIGYNYPPGEANIFGGAFLDTFESIANILDSLSNEGYHVNKMNSARLMEVFTAGRAVNLGKYETNWDDAIYFDAAKYEAPEELTEVFGKKPGNIMTEGNKFFIPGVISGNVFIGLQPPKTVDEAEDSTYHDKTLPPHHQYVAFYRWLRDEFHADAVVHVGTHGTIEFLKGKESGMSSSCYPDMLISDLPHIYIYYAGNPAEGVIAKRRTAANLVSYQPPVFEESELYGEYLELSSLLDSYRQAEKLSPESAEDALRILIEKSRKMEMADNPDEIESELYRMQHSLIPKGLHIFGTDYTDEELHRYIGSLSKRMLEEEVDERQIVKTTERIFQAVRKNNEMKGLIDALASKYNMAKLGGDIYRSPEVLPSGFNLYQFDPRMVPSKAAMERGRKIAENTIESYFEKHGEYPSSAAVVLWGLETSRTQGETLGQILGYLGVRYSEENHIWEKRFELVPLEELGRPRIDVTINICGFFRDMFPNLIENIDDLLHKLYETGEASENNYFIANSQKRLDKLLSLGYEEDEAKNLAVSRMFGPAEGEYGTGLTKIINTKNWQDESELGLSFTKNLRYIYGRDVHGKKVDGLYEDNLKCVEIISQLRSSNEYEITDLDHYYEFFGGLAKSVEMTKGRKVSMLITDTTGVKPHTESVEKSVARGIRTRVLNPRWIDGMLKHKSHGAQKIADRFENIMGLAATTGSVDTWIYDALDKNYVEDEELRRRMAENNPHAYMRILEQMMEYKERGYWDASVEQIQRIKEIYMEMEDELEGVLK